jgi:ankyrin repeat protein
MASADPSANDTRVPNPNLKLFIHAIRAGNQNTVRSLAAKDSSLINATDPDSFGATPLIHAVNTDSRPMVDLLLDLGADINKRSDWWAGSFGVLDSSSDELTEHLLARGATLTPHAAARTGKLAELRAMLDQDPSLIHARGGDGQMPLHFARTREIADLLLLRGADINAKDVDHASTPAQWLATSRPDVAAYLLSRGAASDPFIAVRAGDLDLLERTIKTEPLGIATRITRDRFPGPAPAAGHIYLFTLGEGFTLVHAAGQAGHADVIRWLAARGAEVNARGGYDDATPLHFAAWEDKPAAIHALIDSGADINAKSGSQHDNEPIGWAIVAGSIEAFRTLRARGAKILPHHHTDAQMGISGAFKTIRPKVSTDAWKTIATELAG